MIRLGLTGSIAMGKSTTARLFAEEGAVVYDADAAIHALYAPGGAAAERLRPLFPEAVSDDGRVDRTTLRRLLAADPASLSTLEAAVFPLLASDRAAFAASAERQGAALVVLDLPLLYETGAQHGLDAVVVVTAAADTQRARAFSREGMDAATFELLTRRQLPDEEKRRRADFLIHTDEGLDAAREQVRLVVCEVCSPGWIAPRRKALANPATASDMTGDRLEILHEVHGGGGLHPGRGPRLPRAPRPRAPK